jgi:hypothetical protein
MNIIRRILRRTGIGVGVLSLVIGLASATSSVATVTTHAAWRPSSRLSLFREFPLWSVLPTNRFAVLGEENLGRRRWGAYVYRAHPDKGAPGTICVEVVSARLQHGTLAVASGGAECGRIKLGSHPMVTTDDLGASSGIVVAVVAPTEAVNLRLKFSSGLLLNKRMRLLSHHQRIRARVHTSKYRAVRVENGGCLEQAVALSAAGDSVAETVARDCSRFEESR